MFLLFRVASKRPCTLTSRFGTDCCHSDDGVVMGLI